MNPDRLYYYDAQVDANVSFDSGKGACPSDTRVKGLSNFNCASVKEGLESLHNHLDKGYRPIE